MSDYISQTITVSSCQSDVSNQCRITHGGGGGTPRQNAGRVPLTGKPDMVFGGHTASADKRPATCLAGCPVGPSAGQPSAEPLVHPALRLPHSLCSPEACAFLARFARSRDMHMCTSKRCKLRVYNIPAASTISRPRLHVADRVCRLQTAFSCARVNGGGEGGGGFLVWEAIICHMPE